MSTISNIFSNISGAFASPIVSGSAVISVLLVVMLLSIYEFVVYRLVSHRAFYNKSFNITLSVVPFFIATIILCLQSNVVITLGTIGALAILRFRTAVKDPVDMLYLLWSVHIGITCGCQLYEVAILTALVVTIVLLVFENISLGRRPYILVFRCAQDKEQEVIKAISENVSKFKITSRSYTALELNGVVEFTAKDTQAVIEAIKALGIEKYSVLEYQNDDIV